jgi:hypothetical protein
MNFTEKERIGQVADRIVEDMKLAGVSVFATTALTKYQLSVNSGRTYLTLRGELLNTFIPTATGDDAPNSASDDTLYEFVDDLNLIQDELKTPVEVATGKAAVKKAKEAEKYAKALVKIAKFWKIAERRAD